MKLTVLLTFLVLASYGNGFTQVTLSIHLEKANIEDVLDKIEQKTDFIFLYRANLFRGSKEISVDFEDAKFTTVLQSICDQTNVDYEVRDRQIILKEKENESRNQTQQPQTRKINGRVTNIKGEPLPGTTVAVKGTTIGTITDAEGRFILNIPKDTKSIGVSFVGMQSQEIPVLENTSFDIVLKDESIGLGEIVVVSYGTQLKRDVTGSITQLNAKEMQDMPVGQFAQKLQGKVAGLQIYQNTGKPGQGMGFRIRGSASINAGNTPLFVVDGQPLDGYGSINDINPDEIETFTVLKDASATALYGSRATNGVILITTKKARPGRTLINVNAYYALASLDKGHVPPMMNAREFATYMKGYLEDKITYENWKNPQTGKAEIPDVYKNPDQYGKGTDWLSRVLQVAPTQNYSISISDYRDKSSTAIVAGYFDQQGIVKNTGYERFSLRVNNEFRPIERVKIAFNVAPTLSLDHNALGMDTDGQRRVVEGSLLSSPIVSPFNPDGTLVNQSSSYYNLLMPNFEQIALNTSDNYKTYRVLSNLDIEVEIIKGLKFKTSADVDIQGRTRDYFLNTIAAGGFNKISPRPANEIRGIYSSSNYYTWLNENVLTYQRIIAKNHKIEALAGYTIQKSKSYGSTVNGSNFPDESIKYISAAGITTGTSTTSTWSLLSTIGRLNYSYKEKYLLSGAIRRDGSSRFGSDRKYGDFPSVSAGWLISDEPFLKNIPALSLFKVRSSYGLTGNNNIGNYPSNSLIGTTNYVFGNVLTGGKAITQLGNSLLSWEKNKQLDIGGDLSLFNDRVSLSYDYYHKVTDGLLYQVNIPQSTGFGSVNTNVGTFKFWGHEFALTTRNLIGPFTWTTNFNISFNRNTVVKLGTENLPILPPSGNESNSPWITAVGHPIGMFYGYINDGVYMTQAEFNSQPKHSTSMVGTTRMIDVNKDGKIDSDDRTFIGNPNPDFIYGITNDFTFKNFDFNVVFAGSYGGDICDGLAESSMNLDGAFNIYNNLQHPWRSEANPGDGQTPRTRQGTTTMFRRISSNKIFDGSFFTCKNITLGYTMKISDVSKLRVYFSLQQAFVITPYHGFNPETGQDNNSLNALRLGHDVTNYPVPRTFSLGVNLNL